MRGSAAALAPSGNGTHGHRQRRHQPAALHASACPPLQPSLPASPSPCPPCSALFERATHLQLPPKKMKFLFKRYLEYEKQHGTAAGVEHVKKRALEYVEAQAAA